MLKRFKNIKLNVLAIHLIVTLGYPVVKAITTEGNKLTIFTDALTIVALIIIVLGIFYSFVIHGDFDKVRFVFLRGLVRGERTPYNQYDTETEKKREDAFNYPLFLGIFYFIVCAIISYAFF